MELVIFLIQILWVAALVIVTRRLPFKPWVRSLVYSVLAVASAIVLVWQYSERFILIGNARYFLGDYEGSKRACEEGRSHYSGTTSRIPPFYRGNMDSFDSCVALAERAQRKKR